MKKRRTLFANDKMVKKSWFKIDAAGKVLGRLASKAAAYLRGKHKPLYTPHTDCGDFIVVTNAAKVKVTGNKEKDKMYFTHSGYPGGDKMVSFEKKIAAHPEKIIQLAVRGMLPHSRLGDKLIKKLKIFRGEAPQYANIKELEI